MLKKRLRKTFSSVRLCEFGLEVNAQKFEWLHVFMSRHQNNKLVTPCAGVLSEKTNSSSASQ